MNILLVGSGAREHSIAAALLRSGQDVQLFCCGTSMNPGIKQLTRQYWVGNIADVDAVLAKAKIWQVGLAIIGPEAPLEKGLADALWRSSIPTIGPKQKMARIESSKAFARELMQKYNIPGLPAFRVFHELTGIPEYLAELGEDGYVIKANGLMSGKGVKVAGDHLASIDEAVAYCREILEHGQSLLIEEKLIGQEFSFMCFCDGQHIIPMPLVQDHKRAFPDDKGPNTGGMGSYSDANHSLPFLTAQDVKSAWKINEAVFHALTKEVEDKYIGILYGGFMATKKGVYVIEFNARFGDPEAMNVLNILDSDFVAVCQAMVLGNLSIDNVIFKNQSTVCKYAVPHGYPEKIIAAAPIDISAVKNKANLYLASVEAMDGKIFITNSRTAAYVGVADSIYSAEEIAEKEIKAITGPLFHRADIGTEKLIQHRVDEMRRLRAE